MEFDEWYEKAKDTVFEETEPAVQYRMAKLAWNAALESVKPKPEFGCHIGYGNPYPDCVLDTDDISECGRAETLFSEGKTKESCEYWRHVNE